MARTLEERFWSRVERTPGCWLWTGAKNIGGYGTISANGRPSPAHRVSYEMFVGPIPDGYVIDHLCRTPSCVHPAHLEPVTPGDNIRRGYGASARHIDELGCNQKNCGWCNRMHNPANLRNYLFTPEFVASHQLLLDERRAQGFRAALRTVAPFLASGKPVHA